MTFQDLGDLMTKILAYVSANPEHSFVFFKHFQTLIDQGNLEAVGLIDGDFMLYSLEGEKWLNSDDFFFYKHSIKNPSVFIF